MSAHPNELEPDRSLVYAEAGAGERQDGVLLKLGDAANQPIRDPLSPLWRELFAERQADDELELGGAYRVEAGHGWERTAPAHIADRWAPWPTAEDEREGDRAALERRLDELAGGRRRPMPDPLELPTAADVDAYG